MIEKIGKLLAMAEGASTQAEAEAFFEKAQALASAHAITLAEARLHTQDKAKREEPVRERVGVGEPRRHVNRHLIMLWSGIAGANDVRVNIAHDNTYVILFGMPSDIDVCKLLFANVAAQMVRLGDAYIRAGEWRGEQVWDERRWGMRQITAQSARASYYEGFTSSLSARLRDARAEQVKVAEAEHSHQPPTDAQASDVGREVSVTALALREKSKEISEFYDATSTARGSWRGWRGNTSHSSAAYGRGRSDGASVSLGNGGSIGGARKAVAS